MLLKPPEKSRAPYFRIWKIPEAFCTKTDTRFGFPVLENIYFDMLHCHGIYLERTLSLLEKIPAKKKSNLFLNFYNSAIYQNTGFWGRNIRIRPHFFFQNASGASRRILDSVSLALENSRNILDKNWYRIRIPHPPIHVFSCITFPWNLSET